VGGQGNLHGVWWLTQFGGDWGGGGGCAAGHASAVLCVLGRGGEGGRRGSHRCCRNLHLFSFCMPQPQT
jgi:hypothetical protein